MVSPNGINSGGYWAVFGQNPTGSDGFQNDFPGAGYSYSSILLTNPNIEAFTTTGIVVEAPYMNFSMLGGDFDRSALSSGYTALIEVKTNPVSYGMPIHLSPSALNLGTGTPANGAGSYLLADAGGAIFEDSNGFFANSNITGYYSVPYTGLVAMNAIKYVGDAYQSNAQSTSIISPYRITVQTNRFAEPTSLTPAGSNQTISVTGYNKVKVAPAAAASISAATFTTTPGAPLNDYGRNGDLYIEVTNNNLTINYSSAANGFRTSTNGTSGSLSMSTGQIIHFLWSETDGAWVQD